jgi:hypothetical protein
LLLIVVLRLAVDQDPRDFAVLPKELVAFHNAFLSVFFGKSNHVK